MSVTLLLALFALSAGEPFEVEPRALAFDELSPEVFDLRWQIQEEPEPGFCSSMEALAALRFEVAGGSGPPLRSLGDLVVASARLPREERPAWLRELAGRAPELFQRHGEALGELLLDERLHSSKWKPKSDHEHDGLLLAREPRDLAREGAPWSSLKKGARAEQAAVLVRADPATFKAVENDYRVYPLDVGATYEWIRPVADGYRTGEDPGGKPFSTLRLGMRCDLPFPFSGYSADIRILNRIDARGRLVTDVYSASEDFHWLAGRDVYLPVETGDGELAATLVVRLYGFDLDGVPDSRKHRRTALRGSLGNLKRKAERLFEAERRSFPIGPAERARLPRPRRRTVRRAVVTLVTVLLVLAAGAVLLTCAAPAPDPGLADGALRPCPSSPNCVISEGAGASIEPLLFEGDPERAFASLLDFLAREPRVKLVVRQGDYAHLVARTRTFFKDDLELRLDRGASCIHVRSASRVGYSDLGVNRRRVESIRARWRAGSAP